MILSAGQEFDVPLNTVPLDGEPGLALRFVRSPDVALARVRFLRNVHFAAGVLSGELVVKAPGLGDIDLPFQSDLLEVEGGAELRPRVLTGERAWVSVTGLARVQEQGMTFSFQFEAHVQLPEVDGWGGAAFEKMVNAAAGRTLSRVTGSLPGDIQGAWQAFRQGH